MDNIKLNGFDPELSAIELADKPILWLLNGTHRIGYMLTQLPNFFVPIKFVSNPPWSITNGLTYLKSLGLSKNMLNELLKAYYEIYSKMRKTIVGIIDTDIFRENKEKIVGDMVEYGKMFFVAEKEVTLPQEDSVCAVKWSIKSKSAVMIAIKIDHETLYIKDGNIYSHEVDRISKHFSELFGENWGYIAHTITESVRLEEYLSPTRVDNKDNSFLN